MFTIRIRQIPSAVNPISVITRMETLREAEIIARDFTEKALGLRPIELVYIEDLDYYAYVGDKRIARLTITPIYEKVRTKQ